MSFAPPPAIQSRDLDLNTATGGLFALAIVTDVVVSVFVILRIYVVRHIMQVFYLEDCEPSPPPPKQNIALSPPVLIGSPFPFI